MKTMRASLCEPRLGSKTCHVAADAPLRLSVVLALAHNGDENDCAATREHNAIQRLDRIEAWTNLSESHSDTAHTWRSIQLNRDPHPFMRQDISAFAPTSNELPVKLESFLTLLNLELPIQSVSSCRECPCVFTFDVTFRAVFVGVDGSANTVWLGKHGCNATIRVLNQTPKRLPFLHLNDVVHVCVAPQSIVETRCPDDGGFTSVLYYPTNREPDGIRNHSVQPTRFILKGHSLGCLALDQTNTIWLEPRVASSGSFSNNASCRNVRLLLQSTCVSGNTVFIVAMPVDASMLRCVETHSPSKNGLGYNTFDLECDPIHLVCAKCAMIVFGVGRDPVKLVADMFDAARRELGIDTRSYSNRSNIPRENGPEDYLGWCTWNSFYSSVSESAVDAQLKLFKQLRVPVRTLLIDDGWQDMTDHMLSSFDANPIRFSSGLAGISRIKAEHGIKHLGLWRTLTGYWGGIDPSGPLASDFKIVDAPVVCPEPGGGHGRVRSTTQPSDVQRFDCAYTKHLAQHGIDFLKIDNQSCFSTVQGTCTYPKDATLAVRYILAHQASLVNLAGERPIIWCMAHAPQVLFSGLVRPTTRRCILRSSNDFFPDDPNSHAWHVYTNLINGVYLSAVAPDAVLDWDMFQSKHPFGRLHLIARCVSGGPVNVSDAPGQHDPDLLSQIWIDPDHGRVLRCARPPWPAACDLLLNPTHASILLKAFNTTMHGGIIMIALFNCHETCSVLDTVCVADAIPSAGASDVYVFRSFTSRRMVVVDAYTRVPVLIDAFGCDLILASPVCVSPNGGVVCIATFPIMDNVCGAHSLLASQFHVDANGGDGHVELVQEHCVRGVYGYHVIVACGMRLDLVECRCVKTDGKGDELVSVVVQEELIASDCGSESQTFWMTVDARDGSERMQQTSLRLLWAPQPKM